MFLLCIFISCRVRANWYIIWWARLNQALATANGTKAESCKIQIGHTVVWPNVTPMMFPPTSPRNLVFVYNSSKCFINNSSGASNLQSTTGQIKRPKHLLNNGYLFSSHLFTQALAAFGAAWPTAALPPNSSPRARPRRRKLRRSWNCWCCSWRRPVVGTDPKPIGCWNGICWSTCESTCMETWMCCWSGMVFRDMVSIYILVLSLFLPTFTKQSMVIGRKWFGINDNIVSLFQHVYQHWYFSKQHVYQHIYP